MIADRGISLDLSQFSQEQKEQKEHQSSQPIRGIGVLKHDRKSPDKMLILEGKSSNSWFFLTAFMGDAIAGHPMFSGWDQLPEVDGLIPHFPVQHPNIKLSSHENLPPVIRLSFNIPTIVGYNAIILPWKIRILPIKSGKCNHNSHHFYSEIS